MRGLSVITCEALPFDEIEREWRRLESHALCSFFLTWDWIGSLLSSLEPRDLPRLLRVSDGSETVALGFFGMAQECRHRFVRSRVLHLHETGNRELDRLTVEHNDLLVRHGWERPALEAVLDHLLSQTGWDELRLSGIDETHLGDWLAVAQSRSLKILTISVQPSHAVDLRSLRASNSNFLDTVSKNTRYQIRRAIKLYGARGLLRLHRAQSQSEAEAWFEDLMRLHQHYWTYRGERGAFATDFARRFHGRLIRSAWLSGRVEMVRVDAGATTIGYLYNFQKDGTIYNYQSAFFYEDESKLKPGLVCHSLAIDDALSRGLLTYDLLAGGGHYKQSLAPKIATMHWISLQRPRLVLRVEDALRRIRESWRRRGPGQLPAS